MNYQDRIFESIEAHKEAIRKAENARKEKPTNADLKETVKIFDDFGIEMQVSDIPDLPSAYELEKWRVKKITEYLDSRSSR